MKIWGLIVMGTHDQQNIKKTTVIFLSFILLSSIPAYQNVFAVGFSFGSQINLSNDSGTSRDAQIVTSGSNVYVVFRNSTGSINEIYFSNSNNGGTSFSTPTDLSQSSGILSETPQVAASGANVYAVWEEGDTIVLKRSNDNGNSFPFSTQTLSSGTASVPQIDATGSNVFVTFQDGADVILSSSTNSGSSFTSNNLSNSGTSSVTPQIVVSGSNAYVVWQEGNDISFVKISDNGQTIGTVQNISGTSGTISQKPQIAVSGTNVYVVWIEGTSDIFFKRILNDGTDFSEIIKDLGNTGGTTSADPQIAASGSNVYVVWRDNTGNAEIRLNRSTDSGQNFAGAQNLSNNSGSSRKPQLAASGDDVYVVWRDDTTGNIDILFRGSDDAGANFANSLTISPTSGTSDNPQIAISGSDAHVVWNDDADGDDDILYKKATQVPITISFDKTTPYKLSDTATITITDSSASGTITASIISSTGDTTGFSFTLTEGSTGTFSGSITFSELLSSNPSLNRLKANPGDTITVTYQSTQATATIFSRTVAFDVASYDRSSIGSIQVTDQNSNIDTSNLDTVTITVTSDADTTGVTLTLTETGADTGIFGGSSGPTKSELIFFKNDGIITVGSIFTVTEQDTRAAGTGGLNTDATTIQQITEVIKSTSEPSGISITMNETGADTGIFEAQVTLSATTDASSNKLKAAAGDLLTIEGQSASSISKMLVTPAGSAQGAIKVNDIDTVVATLNLATDSATILESLTGAGGGGGGLVRPSLVVNVLAGASTLGGGGSGPPGPTITLGAVAKYDSASETISMPKEIRDIVLNHNPHTPLEPIIDTYENFDLPLSINGNGFALGGYENTLVTQTIESVKPIEFNIVFYTNFDIVHTSLYFNLGPTKTIAGSDTQVLLYKDKLFEIIDPNGNIATATGSINNEGELKRVVTFSITFSEDIKWSNSDLVIRAWNENLNSGDTIIYDAIKVLPSEEEIAFEESIPEPKVEQLQSTYIPIWIKNNAAWWSQELIEDSDFVAGIEYLIQNKIISIQDNQVIADSNSQQIPEWIKNNAGWWSANLITEQEFIDGLQWLISNGIIQVNKT